jgi:hypothetical protein
MKYMSAVLLILSVIAFAVPENGFIPRSSQLFPSAMVRYSTPIKVSGVLGLVFMKLHGHNSYSGFFTQIEPGIAGGKISVGYRYGEYHFMPIYNIGLALSVMQTWSNPLQDVEGGQTYVGLELVGALSMVGLNGGVFKHIAGDDEDSDWIYSLGIGLGI